MAMFSFGEPLMASNDDKTCGGDKWNGTWKYEMLTLIRHI